jgi:hypothetical protein
MKTISTAGNTVVPAFLALEGLGFTVSIERVAGRDVFSASRGDETFSGEDPVSVLGLVKLVEARGWTWRANDADLERVMRQYKLGD